LSVKKRNVYINVEKMPMFEVFPKYLKGKTIPLQTWTDPEGSRSLSLPDFKIIST
jgi:hypothetical protein